MNHYHSEIEKVLVIDDDENTAAALKRAIEHYGYRVVVAGSWAGALVHLAANDVGIVFSDMRIPDNVSGDQILQLTRLHYPHIKVVLMCKHMTDDASVELLQNGASHCMEKPVLEDECGEVLLQLAEQPFFQSAIENSGWAPDARQKYIR